MRGCILYNDKARRFYVRMPSNLNTPSLDTQTSIPRLVSPSDGNSDDCMEYVGT